MTCQLSYTLAICVFFDKNDSGFSELPQITKSITIIASSYNYQQNLLP